MTEKASESKKNTISSSVNMSNQLLAGKAHLISDFPSINTSYRERGRFWRFRNRKSGSSVYLILYSNKIEPFIVWFKSRRSTSDPRGIIWLQNYNINPTWSKLCLTFTPNSMQHKPYVVTFEKFSDMEKWISNLSEALGQREKSSSLLLNPLPSRGVIDFTSYPNPLDFTQSLELTCHFASGFDKEKDATLTSSLGSASLRLSLNSPVTCYNFGFRKKKAKEKLFNPCSAVLEKPEMFFLNKKIY